MFKVEFLLDLKELKEEISFLKKTWRTKQKLCSLKHSEYVIKSVKGSTPSSEQPSEKLTLLLDWVNAVCGYYGLKVGRDFFIIDLV